MPQAPRAIADNVGQGVILTTVSTGGQTILADEPVGVGGGGAGPGPYDLLCSALP